MIAILIWRPGRGTTKHRHLTGSTCRLRDRNRSGLYRLENRELRDRYTRRLRFCSNEVHTPCASSQELPGGILRVVLEGRLDIQGASDKVLQMSRIEQVIPIDADVPSALTAVASAAPPAGGRSASRSRRTSTEAWDRIPV